MLDPIVSIMNNRKVSMNYGDPQTNTFVDMKFRMT